MSGIPSEAMDPWLERDPWSSYLPRGGAAGGLPVPGGPAHGGNDSGVYAPGLPSAGRGGGVPGAGVHGDASMRWPPAPGFAPPVGGASASSQNYPGPQGVGNVPSSSYGGYPSMSPMHQHAQFSNSAFHQGGPTFLPNFEGMTTAGNGPPQMGGFPSQLHGHGQPSTRTPSTGLGAKDFLNQIDSSALPPRAQAVKSAFEMLGKSPHGASQPAPSTGDANETLLKALTAAISGDRKSLPSWSGSMESLRPWLRQLSLWEVDNNLPKHKWGLKLLQAFPEGSPPRRVADTIDVPTLTSEHGYGAILTAILEKFGPFLEAAGPASIENFLYGTERSKGESLASYVAAKETALQEMQAQVGERLPPRIAGRILLRHANLSDAQRETMAVKYNALLTFDQAAAALRPLDRPDALVQKVAKTFYGAGATEMPEAEEEELQPDYPEEFENVEDIPESDGDGNLTYLVFDDNREYTEEEAAYVWAYNSAYKDARRELQAARKGRQFFKKGAGKGSKGGKKGGKSKKGSGSGKGSRRGTPDELLSKTRCFNCDELGHISRDCPQRDKKNNFFVCQGGGSAQQRIYHATFMNVNKACQQHLEIFAGVRTEGCEAIVDTAAEEAVIGSRAMARLRTSLMHFKLNPVEASGVTVCCAGIGGSARILGHPDRCGWARDRDRGPGPVRDPLPLADLLHRAHRRHHRLQAQPLHPLQRQEDPYEEDFDGTQIDLCLGLCRPLEAPSDSSIGDAPY